MVLQWQALNLFPFPAPDDALAPWLLDPHSFMQRLKRAGIADARVQVLKQAWEFPAYEEGRLLGLQPRRFALIREVLIASAENPWMFARTVIPQATLTGREQLLARLQNRALGTLLFKNPRVTRSDFEFAYLDSGADYFKKVVEVCGITADELWARRSLFYLPAKKLLLTEVFFPTLMELAA